MKVDAALLTTEPGEAAEAARALEAAGFDGVYTFEGPGDPFLPIALAAGTTERVTLMTAVAIAFARSPMTLAYVANDLQRLARGRFVLGLGSQIRAHVERRFSQPWSRPAARMREYVQALRAIWDAWQEGSPLRFRGQFYTHTLMTSFFDPGPNPYGPPPVYLAGVGPRMTAVAGEVADGFLLHPLHTEASLRELTLPALWRGLETGKRERHTLVLGAQAMVAAGRTAEERAAGDAAVRAQIAFYGSTPAYRPVLACQGLEALGEELNRLPKRGRWAEMAERVPDALVEAVALRGTPEQAAARARARYGDLAERLLLVAPTPQGAQMARAVRDALTEAEGYV